jgi:hypothetical protein
MAPDQLPSARKRFRIGWHAVAATGISLGGYSLCSWSVASGNSYPFLVGAGLILAFSGFVAVSLAMILDSDHED